MSTSQAGGELSTQACKRAGIIAVDSGRAGAREAELHCVRPLADKRSHGGREHDVAEGASFQTTARPRDTKQMNGRRQVSAGLDPPAP